MVVKDGLIVLSTKIRDRLSESITDRLIFIHKKARVQPGPHKGRYYYTCRMNNFPDDKMACKQVN